MKRKSAHPFADMAPMAGSRQARPHPDAIAAAKAARYRVGRQKNNRLQIFCQQCFFNAPFVIKSLQNQLGNYTNRFYVKRPTKSYMSYNYRVHI